MNPVAANRVVHLSDYRWSSYRYNAHGAPDKLLSPRKVYTALGQTAEDTQENYRAPFTSQLLRETVDDIQRAACFSVLLGNDRYKRQIELALGRRIGHAKQGRPVTWRSNDELDECE